MNEKTPLNFSSEAERRDWIIKHAEYFSIVRWANGKYYRAERPTLEAAERGAKGIVAIDPAARLLIYAVYQTHDVWVMNVTAKGSQHANVPTSRSARAQRHRNRR